MRIRIYSPSFPWPSVEGAHQVIADQALSLLSLGHQVELVVWQARAADLETAPALFREKGVLKRLVKDAVPESALRRAGRVLGGLLSGRAGPEDYYYPLQAFSTWQSQSGDVDLAIYHYSFAYNWLSRARLGQEKKIWVVQHNHESELFDLRAEREVNPLAKAIHLVNARKLRLHEHDLVHNCDEIVFISREDLKRFEAQALADSGGGAKTRFLPPGFEVSLYERRTKAFKASGDQATRLTLGFIGGMNFDPNRDSVLWILDQLCPLLKKAGFEGRILIGGKSATDQIQAKAKEFSFVELIGFVPEADRFWEQIHFNLIPHVSGSGVRLKLLEGLASGCPTLTTEAGASRIHQRLLEHPLLLVSDDPHVWVEYLCKPGQKDLRSRHAADPLHPLLTGVHIHADVR